MRTTFSTSSGANSDAAIAPATTIITAAVVAVAGCWAAIQRRRRGRLTRRILESLDDRTLRDIGIDRSEIDSIVLTQPEATFPAYAAFVIDPDGYPIEAYCGKE